MQLTPLMKWKQTAWPASTNVTSRITLFKVMANTNELYHHRHYDRHYDRHRDRDHRHNRHHAPPPYICVVTTALTPAFVRSTNHTPGTSQHVAVKSTTQWQTEGSEQVAPFIIDHTSFVYRLYSNVVRGRAKPVCLSARFCVRPCVRTSRLSAIPMPSPQIPVTSSPSFITRCCLLSW